MRSQVVPAELHTGTAATSLCPCGGEFPLSLLHLSQFPGLSQHGARPSIHVCVCYGSLAQDHSSVPCVHLASWAKLVPANKPPLEALFLSLLILLSTG